MENNKMFKPGEFIIFVNEILCSDVDCTVKKKGRKIVISGKENGQKWAMELEEFDGGYHKSNAEFGEYCIEAKKVYAKFVKIIIAYKLREN